MSKSLTASDRSSLIRLASSMEKGSEERKAILAGLKKVSSDVVAVVNINGRSYNYDRLEVEEMLDGRGGITSMYKDADNLPRWIQQAGNKTRLSESAYGGLKWVPNVAARKIPGGGWNMNQSSHWLKVAAILQSILDNPNPPAHLKLGGEFLATGDVYVKL